MRERKREGTEGKRDRVEVVYFFLLAFSADLVTVISCQQHNRQHSATDTHPCHRTCQSCQQT